MPPKPSVSELKEEVAIIAPDGGWGWFVVFGAFICSFVVDGSIMTFGIFLGEIGKSFKAHPTVIGWAHSLLTGFSALLGPLICGLVNHYGFQMVGFAGGIIAALAFLISTFVQTVVAFIIVLGFFGGVGIGMVSLPAVVVVGYYFNKWRNLATSIAVTGSALGVILFPIIMDKLMYGQAWTMKFIFLTCACTVSSFASLIFRPIKPVRVLVTQDEELVEILSEGADSLSVMTLPSDSIPGSIASQQTTQPGMLDSEQWIQQHINNILKVERPMEREDIFLRSSMYSASGYGLPIARSKSATSAPKHRVPGMSTVSIIGPSISIVRPSVKSMSARTSTSMRSIQKVKYHCQDCFKSIIHMTVKMLHFKLLKSISFCLVLTHAFIAALGMYAPYLFLKERAKELGINEGSDFMFVSLGIANIVGRISSGLASFIPGATPLNVSYVTICIAGVASILSILCKDIYTQHVYYAIFGLMSASMSSLRVPILVDVLGIENLTNGYGLTMFVYGVASFMGAPIAGAIVQASKSYNSAYIFSGCMFITGAILLMPISAIWHWEERKKEF